MAGVMMKNVITNNRRRCVPNRFHGYQMNSHECVAIPINVVLAFAKKIYL